MKISYVKIQNYSPIRNIEIDDLGDFVILAGGNGSGKTRFKDLIVQSFGNIAANSRRSLTSDFLKDIEFKLEATSDSEISKLGKFIESSNVDDLKKLGEHLNNLNQRTKSNLNETIVQIGSDRSLKSKAIAKADMLGRDPDTERVRYDHGLVNFTQKWNNFMSDIYQKTAVQDKKIANYAKRQETTHRKDIEEKFPDPMRVYRKLFKKILPDKDLLDIDVRRQDEFDYRSSDGETLKFGTLSSGEQEAIKLVFVFSYLKLRDCIVIIDEPELHLHPTLAVRVIETLKTMNAGKNQLIFLTHSSDLISSYYSTGNVYFIDKRIEFGNQAVQLSILEKSSKSLIEVINEDIGLLVVGKSILFVEGNNSSLDSLVYNRIAEKYNLDLVIKPVGGVENLMLLNNFKQEIESAVLGVNISMIRDKDSLTEEQIKELTKNGKIKCLEKRVLENYFLDEKVLHEVGLQLKVDVTIKEFSVDYLSEKMLEIAKKHVNHNLNIRFKSFYSSRCRFETPRLNSVDSMNYSEIQKELLEGVSDKLNYTNEQLSEDEIKSFLKSERERVEGELESGLWKVNFDGKRVLSELCGVLNVNINRLKEAYLDLALGSDEHENVFKDIAEYMKEIA